MQFQPNIVQINRRKGNAALFDRYGKMKYKLNMFFSFIFRPLFWLLCILSILFCLSRSGIFRDTKWKLVASSQHKVKATRIKRQLQSIQLNSFPEDPINIANAFICSVHISVSYFSCLFIFISLWNVLISLGFGSHFAFYVSCLILIDSFFYFKFFAFKNPTWSVFVESMTLIACPVFLALKKLVAKITINKNVLKFK